MARAIKTLQVLYNEDSNKIVEQAAQKKATKENFNCLIDLALIAMVAEDILSHEENGKRLFRESSMT